MKIEVIIGFVERTLGCDLSQKTKIPAVTDARMIVWKIASDQGYRPNQIATALNRKDHSSIAYYRRTFPNYMKYDRGFRRKYERCIALILSNGVGFNSTQIKLELYGTRAA